MCNSYSCLPLYFYRLVLCWGFWISPFLFFCFSALLISFKLILDWQKFSQKKSIESSHVSFPHFPLMLISHIFNSSTEIIQISTIFLLISFFCSGAEAPTLHFIIYVSLVSFNQWQLLVLPGLMTVALLIITSQLFHRVSHFEFASFFLMIRLKLCICIKKGHRSNFVISPRSQCYHISGDVNLG